MPKSHPLFDTPQGLCQLDSMSARLRAKLRHRSPPHEKMLAWADFRQERYIEPGLEGLTGSGATYHLTVDVPRLLRQAAHLLNGNDCDPTMPPRHTRPRAALNDMAKAYGYRYLRGVYGIECALAEQGVDPERVTRFLKEREDFASEFVPLMDAAFVVNPRGENPLAVFAVLTMFVEEMESLCDWLTLAGQSSVANHARHELASISGFLIHSAQK